MTTTYRTSPTQTVDVGGRRLACRRLGPDSGVPVIFLNHLAAVLDNWDPRVVDGIAAEHPVITFDGPGVGASQGSAPTTAAEMARDAIALVPTSNSTDLARRLPNARLRIYPDAGHSGILQKHDEFVTEALEFLA